MANESVYAALVAQGLLDAETAAALERFEAMKAQGGTVDQGAVMPIDELLALAEITPDDIAHAAADWQESVPAWARGLLDAKPVDVL